MRWSLVAGRHAPMRPAMDNAMPAIDPGIDLAMDPAIPAIDPGIDPGRNRVGVDRFPRSLLGGA